MTLYQEIADKIELIKFKFMILDDKAEIFDLLNPKLVALSKDLDNILFYINDIVHTIKNEDQKILKICT